MQNPQAAKNHYGLTQNHPLLLRGATFVVALLLVVLAMFATTHRAYAQTNTSGIPGGLCMEQAYNAAYSAGSLSCGSQSVKVAQYTNLTAVTSCLEGETLNVTLRAEVQANASTQYDVGLFVGENGGSALNGATCYRDILSPRITPINTTPTTAQLQNGYGPFRNQDGDLCGDIRSTDAISFKVLKPITVVCRDSNANDGVDRLTISTGTTWDNNSGGVCSTPLNTAPSQSSKCFYGDVAVSNIVFRRSAQVEVRKDVISALTPAQETGRFNLLVNNTVRKANAFDTNLGAGSAGTDYSTPITLVDAGTSASPGALVTVSETPGANGTDFANYTSSITCVKRNTPTTVVAGPVAATSASWTIQPGDDIICTITNTRKTATVEVKKIVTPQGDPGAFDLTIDGPGTTFDYTASNQPNGGTTGTRAVTPGSFTFSESGGSSPLTSLDNYNATYACTNKGAAFVPPVSGTGASIAPISVAANDVIVCTFTNARKSGQLKIVKVVAGPAGTATTNWDFNVTGPSASTKALAVAGVAQSDTGFFAVNTGAYSIAETAGADTNASFFNTTASCTGPNGSLGTFDPATRTLAGIQVDNNENVTCTFTNTRKAGKLEVRKALPNADGSTWTLAIENVVSVSGQVNGGTTGKQDVATGAYNISESGTRAADFNSSLACVLAGTTTAVNVSNNTGTAGTVEVAEGADVVCTFTNVRKQGTVEVIKKVVTPAGFTDPGRFNLQINTVSFAFNVGNDGTTGKQTLNTGIKSIGETPNASTNLNDYTTDIVCKVGEVVRASATNVPGTTSRTLSNVALNEGEDLVCTITNTRKTRIITVIKQAIGGSAIFGFTGEGAPVAPSFTLSTTTSQAATDSQPALSSAQTQFTVPSGSYTITEGASPDGWDFTSLACAAGGGSSGVQNPANARQATITVANDGDVTCTWTNTKRGTIVVTKKVNWNGTPIVPDQQFQICIQGPQSQNPLPAAQCQTGPIGQFTFTNLLFGTYSVFENSLNPEIGWFVASSEGDPTLLPGGTATAVITNKRTVGPIEVSSSISTRWTRVYSWDLDKTVDPTQVSLFDGEQTILNYTVTTERTEEAPVGLALFGTVRLTNSSTQTTSLVEEPQGLLPGPTTAVLVCNELILADATTQVIDPPLSTWPYALAPEATLVCGYDELVNTKVTGTATFTATLANDTMDAFTNTVDLSSPQWDVPTDTISETISVADTRVAGWTFPQSDDTPFEVTYPQNLMCSDLGSITYSDGQSLNNLYENTASVVGSTTIEPVTASVNVDCYRLLVTKTAVPTYTLDFDWSIAKSVLPLEQTLYEDETGLLDYAVTVTKDEGTPRDFAARGEIVVTNPNPDADATLDALTDTISDGVNSHDGLADCPSLVVGKGGGTLTCTYDAPVATATTSSIYTNTASATLFSKEYTGTARIDFTTVSPTLVDDSIVVTDTNVAAGLGSFTETTTKQYQTEPTCVGFDNYTNGLGSFPVDNIAGIVALDKTASAGATINCVQYGKITITKTVSDSTPGAWSFDFTLSGQPNKTVNNTQSTATWANLLPNQNYTIAEVDPGSTWITTPIVCTVDDAVLGDASNDPGLQLAVTPGADVQCVTENIATVNISMEKVYTGPATDWEFTFNLAGSPTPTERTVNEAEPTATWSNLTPNATYILTEEDPGEAYAQKPVACYLNGSTEPLESLPGTSGGFYLEPAPGDVITCSIENVERGTVTIEKQTIPDQASIDPKAVFNFNTDLQGLTSFALTDGATKTVIVDPATYAVTEVAQVGWDLTSALCAEAGTPATTFGPDAIVVDPGDKITCVFTNTQRGSLTITKQVEWNGTTADDTAFNICVSGPSLTADCRDYTAAQSYTYENVLPGDYTVTEPIVPPGFDLTSIAPSPANVAPGGKASVTVTNTKRLGTVTVEKTAVPLFTREYVWTLDKSVTPKVIDLFDGAAAINANYTVSAAVTSEVDTAFRLTGTVTIANSSGNTVLVTGISDELSDTTALALVCKLGDTVVTPSIATPLELVDGEQIDCTYDTLAAFGDTKPTATSNKATVTLTAGDPVDGSASFSFDTPTTEINPSINVNDKLEGVLSGEWTYDAPNSSATGGNASGSQQKYPIPFDCAVEGLVYTDGKTTYARTNVVSSTTSGVDSTDTETVTVNCYRLLVSKTAMPTYDNRYTWEISKTVDPAVANLLQGETADLDYTVQVTRTGPVAENFGVSGVITVTNPHPTDTATLESLTDKLSNFNPDTGANAFVPECNTLDVPANGGKLVCTYGGSVQDVTPFDIVENVATATFLSREYSGEAEVNFEYATVTEIDPSITVTDTNQTLPLGENVSENAIYNYTLTTGCENTVWNPQTDLWEKTLPNIAQIKETGQNASAGVDVKCEKAAKIIVEKVTDPEGSAQLFNFTSTMPNGAAFQLSDGMTMTFGVDVGTYEITEILPETGWDLTDASCTLVGENTDPIEDLRAAAVPDNPLSVTVDGGETWQCTFTNTQWGNLAVQKIAPDDAAQVFTFESSIDGAGVAFANLKHTESYSKAVRPGNYTLTELVPDGWTLRDISANCQSDDDALPSAVDGVDSVAYATVAPGLTTTCIFTNSLPSIVLTKTATPAQVPNPGADVVFNVSVENTSKLDPVMIESLTDSIYGDITKAQPDNAKVKATTCVLNTVLQPGQVYACSFTAYVGVAQGVINAFEEIDWVTVKGITDKLAPVEATDDASVVVLAATATVGDHVWLDRNPNGTTTPEKLAGDGLQNDPANEPGVGNIVVELMSVGPDGKPNTGDDTVVDSTTTDSAGMYDFKKVAPGKYYMIFIKPDSSRAWSSQPNEGNDPTIDSDVIVDPTDPNRAFTGVIDVAPGTVDYTWDAALVDTSGAASSDLGDFVWNDINKNGIQDTDEPGITNIKVDLYMVSGAASAQGAAPFDSTTTDVNGNYFFRGLDPGTYYIIFNVPTGYTVSPRNAGGNPAKDNDADADGRTVNIVLPDVVADLTWDAGMYATPTSDDPSEEPPATSTSIFLPAVVK